MLILFLAPMIPVLLANCSQHNHVCLHPQQLWAELGCFIQGWGTQTSFQGGGCGPGPKVDIGRVEAAIRLACLLLLLLLLLSPWY